MRQLNRIDAIRLKCFFPFSFNSAKKKLKIPKITSKKHREKKSTRCFSYKVTKNTLQAYAFDAFL